MSDSLVIVGVYEVYAVFEWVNGIGDNEDPILLRLFANECDAQSYRAHIINRENLDPNVISVEEVSVSELAQEAPTF